jgi:alpha-mannosidase
MGSHATEAKRLEAPHFVEVRSDDLRTAILTGGLPYHCRAGLRMLDSLLVVRGETARTFRLGIGLDLANPLPAALELLAPPALLADVPAPATPSGWFFHIDAKNVVATHWEPVWEGELAVGFRARLLETQGRRGPVVLTCFRDPATARHLDFQLQPIAGLPVEGDKITLQMSGHEWLQMEALWKRYGSNER